VLYHRKPFGLQVLNPTACEIWHAAQSGRTAQQIAEQLCRRFEVDAAAALQDVQATLQGWQQAPAAAERPDYDPPSPIQAPLADCTFEQGYRIAGRSFLIGCNSEQLMAGIDALFAHLPACPPDQANIQLLAATEPRGYRLQQPGRGEWRYDDLDALVAAVYLRVSELAYRHADCLFALHAAGVVSPHGAGIILAAASGRGKSTLSACLARRGFGFMGDDVLAFGHSDMVTPVPLPITVKSPPAGVLEKDYPQLAQLREYRRYGQRVRYLPPPGNSLVGKPPAVRHLVFPSYQAGSTARMQAKSALEGLSLLLQSGVFIHRLDKPAAVQSLIRLLEGISILTLDYGDIDQAEKLLRELAPHPV